MFPAHLSPPASSRCVAAALLCVMMPLVAMASEPSESITFEKHVRPILKEHCFHCHGEEEEIQGGLDVRLKRFLAKGGDSGPAIVSGDADDSLLVDMLRSGEMPEGKDKLPSEQIDVIARWIDSGAPTARPEPERLGEEDAFTEEERSWWSLQPITQPEVPDGDGLTESGNPIDRFVARSLANAGLKFSEEADPRTLIRRLHFDLTGLPPKPEEVEAFVEQFKYDSDSAFRNLVERLLNSQGYGERWARHWLDIAGYADSNGYDEKDMWSGSTLGVIATT